VLSFGAAADAFTAASCSVVSVVRERSVIASFAVAIPFADSSLAFAEACSGSDAVSVVLVSSVRTEALLSMEAVSSLVDAPATCARTTMTAKMAAVSQTPRWFMRAAPLRAQVLGLR